MYGNGFIFVSGKSGGIASFGKGDGTGIAKGHFLFFQFP